MGSLALLLAACGSDDSNGDGVDDSVGDATSVDASSSADATGGSDSTGASDDSSASGSGSGTTTSDTGADTGPPGTCHADQMCPPELDCYAPDVGGPNPCGVSCSSERDCVEGNVCTYTAECPTMLACGSPCTDIECAAGFSCDMQTGVCNPLACPDEYTCPPNFVCDEALVAQDMPGCVRQTCTQNDECDGYCVQGRCFGSPGSCLEEPPA